MSDFKKQLDNAYQKKVINVLKKEVRKTAILIDQQLILNTPVDTGRARANWQVSVNNPILKEVPWNDKTKKGAGYTPPRANNGLKASTEYKDVQSTIYITNNLPYIKRLNDGYSGQAPSGFVEGAIQVGKNAIK